MLLPALVALAKTVPVRSCVYNTSPAARAGDPDFRWGMPPVGASPTALFPFGKEWP